MSSRFTSLLFIAVALLVCEGAVPADKADDGPVKKLSVFLGKWRTEGVFASGDKVTSDLECRWSPQGQYLICEQQVKMGAAQSHQLTVYSYNPKDVAYSYATFQDNGAKPSTGMLKINGYVWVYNSSFEREGKTVQVRNTNRFPNPQTEEYKVESSDDGGATWKPMLQGSARRTGN